MALTMTRPGITPRKSTKGLKKSLRDLNGTWVMSKPLSTGIPPALAIQGFSSRTRQAIITAPIYLFISQSNYPSQIMIKQTSGPSIPSTTERWYPPQRDGWSEWWAGSTGIKTRCRWVSGSGCFTDREGVGFCTEGLGWLGEYLEAEVECGELGWRAVQVWFVEGGKLVKRVVTLAEDGRRAETRFVYEFQG